MQIESIGADEGVLVFGEEGISGATHSQRRFCQPSAYRSDAEGIEAPVLFNTGLVRAFTAQWTVRFGG